MDSKTFLDLYKLKMEKRLFAVSVLLISLAYTGLTLWLNSIRVTAPITWVWFLIAIQYLLYISIFTKSYSRAKTLGVNATTALIIFALLAVLGRVNNWEFVLLPIVVIGMIIFSTLYPPRPSSL